MCAKTKLQFAILEASSKRSPVTSKILKGVQQFGSYDAASDQWLVSGQILRTFVWPHKDPKKQKASLNDFFNRKIEEGKTRHAGSLTIERNFPGRRWDKTSDIVVLR